MGKADTVDPPPSRRTPTTTSTLPTAQALVETPVNIYGGLGFNRTLASGWYNYGVPQYVLQPRDPTWMRGPPAYPAFAEYNQPAPLSDNVDDTGVLLRAFLPFPDAQSRENIRNYTGKAFVLDSRVSCQRPQLTDLHFPYQTAGNMLRIVTTGTYTPSFSVDRLWSLPQRLPFDCSVFVIGQSKRDEAPPAICQIQQSSADWALYYKTYFWENRGGGLISEFSNLTDLANVNEWASQLHRQSFVTWGTAFLVLNATSHEAQTSFSTNYSMADDKTARFRENGIWTEVLTQTGIANFSVSLCYAAWDTARMDVNIFSGGNRTEPIVKWGKKSGFSTEPDIAHQMGILQQPDQSTESRGVLNLEAKESWITTPENAIPFNVMPFVQNFGDAGRRCSPERLQAFPMTGNWTTVLHIATPGQEDQLRESNDEVDYGYPTTTMADDNIAALFKKFFASSGSLARTMSSMITVLSSMAYYGQMARFETEAETTQIYWVNVIFPQAHAGFVAIAVLIIVHNIVVWAVIFWFLSDARSSLLGSYWQSVAQLETTQTADLRLKGYGNRDREVDELLKATGRDKEIFRTKSQLSAESSVEDLVQHAGQARRSSNVHDAE